MAKIDLMMRQIYGFADIFREAGLSNPAGIAAKNAFH
jgi:hypothetical protein